MRVLIRSVALAALAALFLPGAAQQPNPAEPAATDPVKRFQVLFGLRAAEAAATRTVRDDLKLARDLLTATHRKGETDAFRAYLCRRAEALAAPIRPGRPLVIQALERLAQVSTVDRKQALRRAGLMRAEDALAALRKEWVGKKKKMPARVGRLLALRHLEVGDYHLLGPNRAKAQEHYERALAVAFTHRLVDRGIKRRIETVQALRGRRTPLVDMAAFLAREKLDRKTAVSLLRLLLVDRGDLERAATLLDAAGADAATRRTFALAARTPAALAADDRLHLARWYAGLADEAGLRGELALLVRAQGYYQRWFDAADPEHREAKAAGRELDRINRRLEPYSDHEFDRAVAGSGGVRPMRYDCAKGLRGCNAYRYAGRVGSRQIFRRGVHVRKALEGGLRWLARHQDHRGRWSATGYHTHCREGVCQGKGKPTYDIGVTGLALLALLGDGNSLARGRYTDNVQRGIRWLVKQQDGKGRFLRPGTTGTWNIYNQAIATTALHEALILSYCPDLRPAADRARRCLEQARNPYGGWRYGPSSGESDTSVTGWVILALTAAHDLSLPGEPEVSKEAFKGAIAWIDGMTYLPTGRVGYAVQGGLPARYGADGKVYPGEGSECPTALAMLCRFLAYQDARKVRVMTDHANLIAATPPNWKDKPDRVDMCYWYHGTYAMFQMCGSHWKIWSEALYETLPAAQRTDGCRAGSWDPAGVWGAHGGRVYATALMALCLEAKWRYSRIMEGGRLRGHKPGHERDPRSR